MTDDIFLESCGIKVDKKWVSESTARQAAAMLLNPLHTEETKTHVRRLLQISEMLTGATGAEA